MRRLWTDDELDQALAELHADVRPTPNGLAAARERVLAGTPIRSRQFRRAWLPIAAAAAAAALVTTVLVSLPHTAQPAAPPSKGPTPISLRELLSKIHYSDPVVAHGQYQYIRSEDWNGDPTTGALGEAITVWRPANWTDEWQRNRTLPGGYKFEYANGVISRVGLGSDVPYVNQDLWAGCGDFFQSHAQPGATHLPCDSHRDPGNWDRPTPDWVAGLPTDPTAILTQLTTSQQGRMLGPLYVPIHALQTGLFPAKVRAAIYQALAMMPGVYGLRNVPNTDGRLAYAIGFHLKEGQYTENYELLIDPADGTYLGARRYIPDTGAVYEFSGMRYGVVGAQGETPR